MFWALFVPHYLLAIKAPSSLMAAKTLYSPRGCRPNENDEGWNWTAAVTFRSYVAYVGCCKLNDNFYLKVATNI